MDTVNMVCVSLLLLVFAMTVSVEGGNRHLCGAELANTLRMLCGDRGYNTPQYGGAHGIMSHRHYSLPVFRSKRAAHNYLGALVPHRMKRGTGRIVQECCRQTCSLSNLALYCAPQRRPIDISSEESGEENFQFLDDTNQDDTSSSYNGGDSTAEGIATSSSVGSDETGAEYEFSGDDTDAMMTEDVEVLDNDGSNLIAYRRRRRRRRRDMAELSAEYGFGDGLEGAETTSERRVLWGKWHGLPVRQQATLESEEDEDVESPDWIRFGLPR